MRQKNSAKKENLPNERYKENNMPCFSRIINTKMSLADNIVKVAEELAWQVGVGENNNYISIRAGEARINLTRADASENFITNTGNKKHLDVLKRQYNVVHLKNWADRMGYEVKETKKEITI